MNIRQYASKVKATIKEFLGFSRNEKRERTIIRVALLVDEFFGAAGTAYGGYGFLARYYIAKYIPNDSIKMDLLLGFADTLKKERVDNINVYHLPKNLKKAKRWLNDQNYDLFLSIELTSPSYRILRLDNKKTKLLLWIQDPRPWYEWREINSVKLFPEGCYWDSAVYEYVHELNRIGKVHFISQGMFLNDKARDLYRLDDEVPIEYMPNPIETDLDFDPKKCVKKKQIIFLGRIESVKRGWIFCEIAKRMPEYEFYMLGQTFREKDKNSNIIDEYRGIENLHFEGHVEGIKKEAFLKESMILVNTSIHEAIPISFLEALSYGTLIVSNRDPEGLTSRFGRWVGDVPGDGFDAIDRYVAAIKDLMEHKSLAERLSIEAVEYIRNRHSVQIFVARIRKKIGEMCDMR